MIEERGGRFVVNVKDASWQTSDAFGSGCNFEKEGSFADVAPRRKIDPPAWPLD